MRHMLTQMTHKIWKSKIWVGKLRTWLGIWLNWTHDQLFDEPAYEGDDDFSVFNDGSNDYGDFKGPIYDGESDENHDDELNTPIWDVYEDNDAQDKIYDMSQDCDFDDKINLNEHLDYEETPINIDEKIHILDGADLTKYYFGGSCWVKG